MGRCSMGSVACTRKAPDLTPEGAGTRVARSLDRVEADPTEARAVYELAVVADARPT